MADSFGPGELISDHEGRSRLWEVGTWREVGKIDGDIYALFPGGDLVTVLDKSGGLKLVEIKTGRSIVKLELPDQRSKGWASYSPDGSRLVITTNDPPSAQVVDLRKIRRQLAGMGLDWDAPAFSEDDPADDQLSRVETVNVDHGSLEEHFDQFAESTESLLQQLSMRIQKNPNDFDALHRRAHALQRSNRATEAIDDISRAIHLCPNNPHFLQIRGRLRAMSPDTAEAAIADLEAVLDLDPKRRTAGKVLASCCNNVAWAGVSNQGKALRLSARAVELDPGKQVYLNTRGVVLYRAGRMIKAIDALEKSLKAGRGQFDAFDLYFMAMAHHRVGHRGEARRCFDRAVEWTNQSPSLTANYASELAEFHVEAEAILDGPMSEFPVNVFANSKPGR